MGADLFSSYGPRKYATIWFSDWVVISMIVVDLKEKINHSIRKIILSKVRCNTSIIF